MRMQKSSSSGTFCVALVSVVLLAGAGASGQSVSPEKSCAELRADPAQFHKCAIARAATFSPRPTPDGHPDLRGFWGRTLNSYDLEDHPASFMIRAQKSMVVDPADGKIPYQAWAIPQRNKNAATYVDPNSLCRLSGVPRTTGYMSDRILLHQSPDYVAFLSGDHGYRIVSMKDVPHVGQDIRLWNGDARGRWDGNTLVIDVANQNGKTWFDIAGNFASESVHVTERLTLIDANTIHYQATIDDPKVFTRPWTIAAALIRNASDDKELWLEECYEGEQSSKRLLSTHGRYPGYSIAVGR